MIKYSYTELGMIFVMCIGIGVTTFTITNNASFHTFTGFGIVLGLGTGSLLDKKRRY